MKRERYTAYVVPHSHWDREWYEPFETFRARLVRLIDGVLERLRLDPAYTSFTLDGQTIVLRDYLTVRPEREAELRQRIAEGRIRIGPWFVLADEFLVSPEALVRNLELGRLDGARFGDWLPVLYTPDSFGHVSTLPTLAAGFGLESIVFERGVGDEGERLRGEFLWEDPAGEHELFAAHLLTTYSSAAAIGHSDWELRDSYDPEKARVHAHATLYGATGDTDLSHLPTWFADSLRRIRGGQIAYATGQALLLMNGSDHLLPQPELPQVLAELNEIFLDVAFEHADVATYIDHSRSTAASLERHRGEFRGSRYQHVLSGVLSARTYLKQANDAAQTRLEKRTEPLATLAWLHGAPYPRAVLDHAWATLLENHAHDSICGCSVDAVHEAMMPRFAATHHLADPIEREARSAVLGHLGGDPRHEPRIALEEAEAHAIAVFNPHPFPAVMRVEALLRFDGTAIPGLHPIGADGLPLPAVAADTVRFEDGRSDRRVTDRKLAFAAELAPFGVSTFPLRTSAADVREDPRLGPLVRVQRREDGSVVIANDRIGLDVATDGTTVLRDHVRNRSFPLHLRFLDEADAGDSYDFSPLREAPIVIERPDGPPEVTSSDSLRAELRLRYRATLPARVRDTRDAREGSVPFEAAVTFAVEAGRTSLELTADVDNRAQDHRLRLVVSTDIRTDHVHAEGHFDVVRTPIDPPVGDGWFQAPQSTRPQRRYALAWDGERSVAVLNHGLREFEPIRRSDGSLDLAVTLLRAFGWLSRDDLSSRPQGAGPPLPTPAGQVQGRHSYHLAIVPLPGQNPWSELTREVDLFAAPPEAHVVGGSDGVVHGTNDGRAPGRATSRSFLRLPDPLVLTAFTRTRDRGSIVFRVHNPSPTPVTSEAVIGFPAQAAYLVRLDHLRLGDAELEGDRLRIDVPPNAVRSYELVPPEEVIDTEHDR